MMIVELKDPISKLPLIPTLPKPCQLIPRTLLDVRDVLAEHIAKERNAGNCAMTSVQSSRFERFLRSIVIRLGTH
jgi:hypothetical protein